MPEMQLLESAKREQARRREEARKLVAEVCYDLGCSGVSRACPADPNCNILRKIFRHKRQ